MGWGGGGRDGVGIKNTKKNNNCTVDCGFSHRVGSN